MIAYRRDYQRPCRLCRRPILNAARNQRLHDECERHQKAQLRKIRRECARAAGGLFPGDRKRLEEMKVPRRKPATPAIARAYYRWLTCKTPECGSRFFAGRNAELCDTCRAGRLRSRNARQHRRRKLRGRRPPRDLRQAS